MPDYIYLLKNRLSLHQRNALESVREAARVAGMTVFLVGGAVRDLTSGSPVSDLDVTVQGNALKLKQALENAGAVVWGEYAPSQTLFLRFPGGVSVEISSARREEYPKPGKPEYHWDTILEDLRRRDFTANAMALSLNEHSYGLLMDPLNGVADIEARQLRLVSNYGFIEDPSRLLRATRLMTRLGWQMDERTQTRFQTAKDENMMENLSSYHRGYELEEICHEEDGLRVLTAMESEGWMQLLFPAWTHAAVDTTALEEMRRFATQLQVQGVSPDISAASAQYLTAKLNPKDLAALKALFIRPGFVENWNNLDNAARDFSKQLTGKEAATPSATWKLFTSADPQAVLWLGITSKTAAVQAKYKNFFTVWPEARQKIPYALFLEMRITPEITGYDEMLAELFFGTIDGKLDTDEALRAFLAPWSPPAPPPPVTIRKSRGGKRGEAKAKAIVEPDFDGPSEDEDDDDEESDEEPGASEDEDDDEDEDADLAPPPAPRKVSSAKPVAAPSVDKTVSVLPGEESAKKKVSAGPDAAPAGKPEKVVEIARPAKVVPVVVPVKDERKAVHPPAPAPAPVAVKKAAPLLKSSGPSPQPVKATPKAPVPAKPVAAKTAAKAPAAAPLKKVTAAKPLAHPRHEAKPAVPVRKSPPKPVAHPHKKAAPAKKAVAKKAAPARKHR